MDLHKGKAIKLSSIFKDDVGKIDFQKLKKLERVSTLGFVGKV